MAHTMLKGVSTSGLLPVQRSRKSSVQQVRATPGDEIYIGFPKTDYARPPGRRGRMIKDDLSKYPGRDDLGPIPSVVGGWAGGEAGLQEFIEQCKAEEARSPGSGKTLAPSSPVRAPVKNKWGAKPTAKQGKDAIYVGFSKDELELRKTGVAGRVIYDDAYRYPGREDLGFIPSVIGGFAGGEAGLTNFVETGELRLRKPGDPVLKKQFSPLNIAFLLFFGAAGAGLILAAVQSSGGDAPAVAEAVTAVAQAAAPAV